MTNENVDYDNYPYEDWTEYLDNDYDGDGYDPYPTTTSPVFDVDEYDEVFSAFHDARKQMNDLRMSRGFYPIVAVMPEFLQKGKGKGKTSTKGKSRGKGNRPKGKGKGATRRTPPMRSSTSSGKGRGKSKGVDRPRPTIRTRPNMSTMWTNWTLGRRLPEPVPQTTTCWWRGRSTNGYFDSAGAD